MPTRSGCFHSETPCGRVCGVLAVSGIDPLRQNVVRREGLWEHHCSTKKRITFKRSPAAANWKFLDQSYISSNVGSVSTIFGQIRELIEKPKKMLKNTRTFVFFTFMVMVRLNCHKVVHQHIHYIFVRCSIDVKFNENLFHGVIFRGFFFSSCIRKNPFF